MTDPDSDNGTDQPARSILAGIPAMVWAAAATLLVVAACYSVVIPAWSAPDEQGHVDLTYQFSETWDWPAWNDAFYTEGVLHRSFAPIPRRADDAPDARPSLGDLGGPEPSDVPNHIAQHPPLYYSISAGGLAVAKAVSGGEPFGTAEATVGLLRLGNALLIATTPILAWLLARRCGADRNLALTAAVIPLAIPGFAQMGGAVNNDNFLVVPLGLAMLGLVSIVRDDRRLAVSLGTGAAMGIGLAAKATAVFILVPAAIVVFVVWRRRGIRDGAVTATALGLPVLALCGWWYLPKLLREGRPVPSVQPSLRSDLPGGDVSFSDDFPDWLVTFLEWTSDTFVSRAGWVEVELEDWVTVMTAVVLVALVVLAAAWPTRPSGPRPGRRTALLLLSPIVVMFLAQASKSWDSYSPSTGVAGLLHARYLYAFLVPFAVLVARGLHLVGGRVSRWLPLVVLAGGGALHATATTAAIDHYWGDGPGIARVDLGSVVAWSPWPRTLTLALFACAVVAAAWLAVTTAREATRSAPGR